MAVLEIQVQFNESTNASQTLTLDDVRFRLDTYTNKADSSWYMDIFDDEGVALVQGIALVSGLDLLFPYRYLDVPPGALFLNSQTDVVQDPTLDSFQSADSALYYNEVGTETTTATGGTA